eukprot:3120669-Rhodomonas_salina.1
MASYAMFGTDVGAARYHTLLGARYEMSGTEVGDTATLSSYQLAMRCPVLRQALLVPGTPTTLRS